MMVDPVRLYRIGSINNLSDVRQKQTTSMVVPKEERVLGSKQKRIIGLTEEVTLIGLKGRMILEAKVDTGATRTAVDHRIAAKVGLGPITSSVRIRSSTNDESHRRSLVEATVLLADQEFKLPVAIADRRRLKDNMIIGTDILKSGAFLIDPSKP